MQAERDTLAARVATLERERAQLSDLGRHSKPAHTGSQAANGEATSEWWWTWLLKSNNGGGGDSEAGGAAAVAAVQRHLVTVTTDRDLLAGDLYRCMLERTAALRDRDAALQALREATSTAGPVLPMATTVDSRRLHLAPDTGAS